MILGTICPPLSFESILWLIQFSILGSILDATSSLMSEPHHLQYKHFRFELRRADNFCLRNRRF